MLYGKQKEQAKQAAQDLLASGVNPEWMVRINFYPDLSPLADEEIMGLTDPVDPIACEDSLVKYYSVKELAEM
jgi:hypothetical protein